MVTGNLSERAASVTWRVLKACSTTAALRLKRNLAPKIQGERRNIRGVMYICTCLTFSVRVTPLLPSRRSAFVPEIVGEQATWRRRNLRSWQKRWHRTCLPVKKKFQIKALSPLRWDSKWVVSILPVLITDSYSRQSKQHEAHEVLHSTASWADLFSSAQTIWTSLWRDGHPVRWVSSL